MYSYRKKRVYCIKQKRFLQIIINFSVRAMIFDNPKSMRNTFQATTFKVEENSSTFQGLAQKFEDLSRKNGIQGLSRTSTKIQGLFKTVRALQPWTKNEI